MVQSNQTEQGQVARQILPLPRANQKSSERGRPKQTKVRMKGNEALKASIKNFSHPGSGIKIIASSIIGDATLPESTPKSMYAAARREVR